MDTRTDLGQSSRAVEKRLFLLGSDEIARAWPRIEMALDVDPSLWNTAWTKDDLLAQVVAGHVQVWVVELDGFYTMILMTQIYTNFVSKTLQIFWAYGEDMFRALDLMSDVFDDFGATYGCTKLEIVGRKGFERVLRPFGFEPKFTSYERDIAVKRKN